MSAALRCRATDKETMMLDPTPLQKFEARPTMSGADNLLNDLSDWRDRFQNAVDAIEELESNIDDWMNNEDDREARANAREAMLDSVGELLSAIEEAS